MTRTPSPEPANDHENEVEVIDINQPEDVYLWLARDKEEDNDGR